MRAILPTALTWIVAAGVMLACSAFCSAQQDDAQANSDDRLKVLAQQLASDPVVQASTESEPATSTATPSPSPNEQLPLQRPDIVASSTSTPLARPTWSGGWVLNTVTALGVVILVILGIHTLLTRMGAVKGGRTHHPAVEVLTRTMVAPRNHVLLMRVGGRVLVVGDSPAGLRTLAQIDDPAEIASLLATTTAASPNSISRGFSSVLGRFNREFDDTSRVAEEGGDDAEHTIDRARDRVSGLLARMRTISAREASS